MRSKLFAFILMSSMLLGGQTMTAQSGVVWKGEFYNTAFFLGGVVYEEQSSAIAFDWGAGSPDAAVNDDNFSVRWGTDVFFPAGTYRFWALADDQVKVNVNFAINPLINTFDTEGNVGQIISGDITLNAGTHHIQVDYREFGGNARVFVTWANLATNPTGPNFPTPEPQPVPINIGPWTAQYYSNQTLTGSPTAILAETTLDHDWGSGTPANNLPADGFSARWTALTALNAGDYRLRVRADDGVRVTINGTRWLDEWHGATGETYTRDLTLAFGNQNFMVEYYEGSGNAFIEVELLQLPTASAPPTPTLPASGVPSVIDLTGSWVASYYNNRTLSGTPAAILTEALPNHDWGSGAPIASVFPDNFSARWTSTQTIDAGQYVLEVDADDGVRVYIDNVLVLDEWHSATATTYTRDVNLSTTGPHTFTIDYYEAEGRAFIDVSLRLPTAPTPSASGVARVTAFRLNVRAEPNTNAAIVTKIDRDTTYPVVGCSADQTWWQLDVNGARGWAFGSFLDTTGATCVPNASIDPVPDLPPTGFTVTASTTVNIRSRPTSSGAILGSLRDGQSAAVVGRNNSATWWQININGIVGWVSNSFAPIQAGADLNRIPVNG